MDLSNDELHAEQYAKDWRQHEEEHMPEDWDFDPKFRTGSISEETPDEKRRMEFYAEHAREILSVFNASIAGTLVDTIKTTILMNYCALVVSELANRAGEKGCLHPGDPEFGNASCIDEL